MSINFGSLIVIDTSWTDLKQIAKAKHLPIQYYEEDILYTVFAVDSPIVYVTGIQKGEVPYGSGITQEENDAIKVEFESRYKSSANSALNARSSLKRPVVEAAPRDGSKLQIISQNFCDKSTWWTKSIRRTGQVLTSTNPSDGNNIFALPSPTVLVDVSHGRIFGEDKIAATYKPVVYVDGAVRSEIDPDTGIGDYTIDYSTGTVTFAADPGGTVTMDYSEVTTSEWYITPEAGKRIRMIAAELQFSTDCRMKDTFIFQVRATVGKCPLLNPYWNENPDGPPGPYPTGTILPLGQPVKYKTVFDLIVESSGAFPIIPKTPTSTPGWRDLKEDIIVFKWPYDTQATIDVRSSWGMDVEIKLENNRPCEGSVAVATFYGISEVDD